MLEQYFKNDEINIKSHIKGYVSEKDLDKTAIDNQCVTDCNNMDFYPDHDRRRNPFDVYLSSLATLLTSLSLTDYKIHNICEKRFYDKDGNYADCLIAVVTYQGIGTAKPTKIFINQWYNPGSDYENGSGTASDFFPPTGDWMEITEYYDTSSYTFEAGSWVIGANTYTLRSSNATIYAKADEYFKGFFVTHSDNRVIGIVTKSLKEDLLAVYSYSEADPEWLTVKTYTGDDQEQYDIKIKTMAADGGGEFDYEFEWKKSTTGYASLVSGKTSGTLINLTNVSVDSGALTVDIILDADEVLANEYVSVTLSVDYTYFKLEKDSTSLTSANKLTRFPVTHFNYDNWTNVTNVEINKDFPNVIRFYCENYRALWFGFIKDRTAINYWTETISYSHSTGSHADWGDAAGVYSGSADINFRIEITAKDVSTVTAKYGVYDTGTSAWVSYKTQVLTKFTYDGSDYIQATFQPGYNITLAMKDLFADWNVGDIADFAYTSNVKYMWDGFWFGFDTPEVLNRKTYTYNSDSGTETEITGDHIGYELGVLYDVTKISKTTDLTVYSRIYSLALELDEYQAIFVKQNLACDRHLLTIDIKLERWFDRRITASLLFYVENDETNPQTIADNELPATYLCDNFIEIDIDGILRYINGYRKLQDVKWGFTGTTASGAVVDNQNIELVSEDEKIPSINYRATGTLLNTYLNHYYWKALEVKAKGGTKVGDNILAYNLSEDTMELDKDSKGNVGGIGKTALTVSNIQNGGINTPSVMTTERIRELARDEILGVKCIYGTSFLLFTETETKWYELDDTNYVFTNVGNFQYGCVASKSIVEASTQDIAPTGTASYRFGARMFNGIYWASYDSIYAFFQNEPVDILDGKWKKEYQEILELTNFDPETDIIGAYNPYMNEVWFWFKLSDETGYTDRIYVYNIDYKHWKKYTYFQTSPNPTEFIKGFAQSNEGMLYWWMDDNIIYTQEPEGTGNKQDYTSGTPKDITFFYEQYINHGNTNIIKTLDRIDLIYDITPYETGGKYSRVDAYIEVKANAAETSILSSSDLITLQTNVTAAIAGKLYKKRIPIKLRIPNNFIKLKFSSDTSTDSNIKQLKLLQLTINSKISRGTLTKN